MFSLNRIQLIGYQTQPVAVRQTPGGTAVTDLNLVVPHRFRAEGGEMLEGKSFHTVTLWGPMADVAGKYAKAGSQIFIAGRLQTDSWNDEKSGEKRSKTKIVALEMILLDPREGALPYPESAPALAQTLNRADVIGNVTRDPEMRTTTSGQHVLTLGVATNERWKDRASGQDKERSEFHNVVLWGESAEAASKILRKGNRVFVSGRVQTRSWQAQDGSKRFTTEIVADAVSLLGTKNPHIEGAIQTAGTSASTSDDFPSSEASAATLNIPPIQYASEVKVEDLPF